jgi:predicted  nucleic acid-binding Zn-ribbon protein
MDRTIIEIEQQIQALKQSKEYHHQKYLSNISIIDEKTDRIEKQIERTKSVVKRDLLKRHLDWFENEIVKMDEAIDVITQKIDSEIERLQEVIKSVEKRKEKEKNSFEYNIEKIRTCYKDGNSSTIFEALESVANALEIIRAEKAQT